MTIQTIRYLQIISQTLLALAALSFISALLQPLHQLHSAQTAMVLALGCAVSGGILMLIIGRVRCPVCNYRYAGRRHKSYFSRTCRNCGRRAGDTS